MAQHALLPALTGRSLSRVSTKLSAARPHSGALVTTTTDSQLLQLVDCGSAGLSCLTLSISAGLTGSTAASPLLRRLASASLAAYALDVYQPPEGSPDAVPTGAELDSFYAWSFEEAVCARTYGCALGQQTIVALSTALGVPIHYSMRLEDGNMPWDVTLATTPAGLARSTSAQPLYVWHTGSFHYMCGVPVSEGAVWSPPWSSWSEVEINAMLTTCIDEAEAAARSAASSSCPATVRAATRVDHTPALARTPTHTLSITGPLFAQPPPAPPPPAPSVDLSGESE